MLVLVVETEHEVRLAALLGDRDARAALEPEICIDKNLVHSSRVASAAGQNDRTKPAARAVRSGPVRSSTYEVQKR